MRTGRRGFTGGCEEFFLLSFAGSEWAQHTFSISGAFGGAVLHGENSPGLVTKTATKCRQCWVFGADSSVNDSDFVRSCKEIMRRKNNLTR
jgi:hypothetical protein